MKWIFRPINIEAYHKSRMEILQIVFITWQNCQNQGANLSQYYVASLTENPVNPMSFALRYLSVYHPCIVQ